MTINEVRASDADRARIAERITNAAAEGRLTMEETDERLSSVYAARYQSELDRLVADLPTQPQDRPGLRGRPGTRGRPGIGIALGAVVLGMIVLSGIVHALFGYDHGPHFFPWPLFFIALVAWRLGAFRRWSGGRWGGHDRNDTGTTPR